MRLFRPDNFSKIYIDYSPIDREDYKTFLPVLDSYFDDYEIQYIGKLKETEINSNNFKIVLKTEKQERVIFLRKFKALKNKELVNFYLQLIKELKENEVKVSSIIENKRKDLVTEMEDCLYAVFEFIAAEHFTPTKEGLISIAEAVAKMHKAFNQLNQRYFQKIRELSLKNTEVYFNKVKGYNQDDFENIKNIIRQKKDQQEIEKNFLEEASFINKLIREVKDKSLNLNSLPKGIIHSDLHPHNILMKDDKVEAIIDFDSARISQQARDVAFIIYRFGRQFFVNKEMADNEIKKQAIYLKNIFLKKYLEINYLTKQEIKMMPFLIKDDFLIKLLFVLKGVYQEDNSAWAKDLDKFIMALREINYFWPL